MANRAARREKRRQDHQDQFERTKRTVVQRLADAPTTPRIAQLPDDVRLVPRTNVPLNQLSIPEQPRAPQGGSTHHCIVTWCVRRGDVEGSWTWGERRAWTDDDWVNIISPAFSEFELLTWAEIERHTSGTGHRMHHAQEVGSLVPEAQYRWLELGLEEFDTAFRFRLGGTRRFWGFRLEAHFFGVWWDREHSLYPVD